MSISNNKHCKECKHNVFGDTCQPSSVILTTSCAIQRRHITAAKVDQHLGECLQSAAAVTPVIGQSRDARKQGWSDGRVYPKAGDGVEGAGRREGNIDADERKGSERFRREVARDAWGDGSKERNRQGTQQVFPARLPPLLQVLSLSQVDDDSDVATQTPICDCGAEQDLPEPHPTLHSSSFCKIERCNEKKLFSHAIANPLQSYQH